MKKFIITTILWSITMSICSQIVITADTTNNVTIPTFTQMVATAIAPLDKNKMNTGFLADKSLYAQTFELYSSPSCTKPASYPVFELLLTQIQTAAVRPNNLPSKENINTTIAQHTLQNVVPLGFINLNYNSIKKEALTNNLLRLEGNALYDVPGSASPYHSKTLCVLTPLKSEVRVGTTLFKADPNLFINNTTSTITSIQINFDDGTGFKTVYTNNSLANNTFFINYQTAGIKTLTSTINFNNGTSLTLKSTINVLSISILERTTSIPTPDDTLDCVGRIYNQSDIPGGAINTVAGGLPYSSVVNKASAFVFYGKQNGVKRTCLLKPIIIGDGFDPGNERNMQDIYLLLNRERMADSLRNEGYDVIVIDYPQGGGFIQRNAMVLANAITQINTLIQSNGSKAKLVIVGPSMSGLITRFALKYMENNNLNHNTRLFISFDSPHLGANIPLGIQCWIAFFELVERVNKAEKRPDEGALNKINSPAAKQLLIYHWSTWDLRSTIERKQLYADPNFSSFPSLSRNVAVSNGSGTGEKFFNPGDKLIDYRTENFWANITGNVWALPYESSSNLSSITELLYDPLGPIFLKLNLACKGTELIACDGAPGGYAGTVGQIADGRTDSHIFGWDKNELNNSAIGHWDSYTFGDIQTNHPNHCFIPTKSALAMSGTGLHYNGFALHNNDNTKNIQPGLTPFDAIYAPSGANQEHCLITLENKTWMMEEIRLSPHKSFLQNRYVLKHNYWESVVGIRMGAHVTTTLPQGDFVIQQSQGSVDVVSKQSISIEPGTIFAPSGTGVVNLMVEEPLRCK